MKLVRWLLIVGLFLLMPAVATGTTLDGKTLLQKCEPIEKLKNDPASMSSKEASGVVYCLGYIDSFLETFSFQVQAKIVPSLPYCMPEEQLPKKEIVHGIVEYLKKNQEELDKPAGYHIFMSLREVFPCNQEESTEENTSKEVTTEK